MKKFLKKLGAGLLSLGLALSAGAGVVSAEDKPFDGEKVKVGVASDYEADTWEVVVEQAAEEGIEIEVVLFTDYNTPNISLNDGDIDLNAMQHIAFLNDWNESNDGNLLALGYTYVAPIQVYSEKIDSLDELQEGDTIAIPNDPTNGGRALLALQTAGVIEVDPSKGVIPTVSDITSNPLNLEFKELEAGQLATILPDVAAAVINNNFALDAGLSLDDSIFSDGDDIESLPAEYKNVIAAHKDNADSDLYKRIVELYQSEKTAEKLAEVSKGADIPAWSENDEYPVVYEVSQTETEKDSEESKKEESGESEESEESAA